MTDARMKGYCTDCENQTEIHGGRCGCGSGRVITIPAGYRLVGPGELDGETKERCAKVAETTDYAAEHHPTRIADAVTGKRRA